MSRISRQFMSYQDMVIPRDAPAVQLSESRRAFYAGAMAALTEVAAAGRLSDDMAVARLQELTTECVKFSDEVIAGLA